MKHLICIAALAGLGPLAAAAQSEDDDGGLRLTFGIRQQLEASTDTDLSDTAETAGGSALTTLSFGLMDATRIDALDFGLTAGLRLTEGDATLADPTARLSYSRSSADAELTLNASWTRTDIAFARDLADFTDADGVITLPDDLDDLTGTGTRDTTTLGASLRWGETTPIGYSLAVRLRDLSYTDADAADSRATTVTGGLRLRVSSVITGNTTLRYTTTDTDGEATTDVTALTAGLTFARPLGDITANVTATRPDDDDTRWGLSVGRSYALPRVRLSGNLGLTEDADGDAQITGRVAYRYALPEGQIDLSASRAVTAGGTTDGRSTTTLQASYAQTLTPLSNMQVGFDYARARDADGTALETGSLSASYGMRLTQDWQLNLGAAADLRDDDGVRTRSNSLFMVLDRSFTYRP